MPPPVVPDVPVGSLSPDGKRRAIYPADVHGRFALARRLTFLVLLAVYAALPWIQIGGHPAVFLDIPERHFHLFGATFNAQDVWMMTFLLLGVGFGLIYLTAVAGRVWCGWACPQTVFLEAMFRPIERWLQGPRNTRLRRDAGPWTWDRVWRKTATHAIYVVFAVVIAHVFLSYFVSLPALFKMVRADPGAHPEAFGIVTGLTLLLYFDFAWFREQTCVIVCPYGRLQSVLVDGDSLVVGYDARRGEPRGKAKRTDVGDCVDCGRCVAVCPTGIDIRQGLQLDCIACTACIDACDDVMDRLGRPRGLIRYDSQRGLAGEKRRFVRPRLIAYTATLVLGGVLAVIALGGRKDFEANVLRTSGAPYVLDGDEVRNSFLIHIVNKRNEPTSFVIEPEHAADVTFVVPIAQVTLEPFGSVEAPIVASMPRARFRGDQPLRVEVEVPGEGAERHLTLDFLGPRP